MTTARAHVGVEVGDGLVARFGDTLVLVAEPSRYPNGTEQLLDAVETMASEAGSPGASIAVRLAGIIAGPGTVPPFGVVAPLDGAHVVLLHGPVWVEITGPDGVERLSGQQAVTWVDRRLESLGLRLTMGHGDGPVSVDPRSDLRAGLVPGSGFVLTTGADQRAPMTQPAPDAVAPATEAAWTDASAGYTDSGVADLQTTEPAGTDVEDAGPGHGGPGVDDATISDLEVVVPDEVDLAGVEPAAAGAAEASDTVPATGGAGDELVAYEVLADETAGDQPAGDEPAGDEPAVPESEGGQAAGEAGASEVGTAGTEAELPTSAEPSVAGPTTGEPGSQWGTGASSGGEAADSWWRAGPPAQSPTLSMGNLVSTDGMRIPLDRDYVLGREPESDPAVANRTATPVRLTDDDNLISRVQSYITIEAGQVTLKDAASANGTYVAAPGAPVWTRLGSDPVVLPPTWSMRVGNRVFTYTAP